MVKTFLHQLGLMFSGLFKPENPSVLTKPYVTEHKGIRALHFNQLSTQSKMKIAAPDELVIDYTYLMMGFLLLLPSPERLAVIGLGGGSLPKYCLRYLPNCKVKAIEINPDVIALRDKFAIPAESFRFQTVLEDGAQWVKNSVFSPNVLLIDGFDEAGLSGQLCTQQFYDDCFSLLPDGGVLVANFWLNSSDTKKYIWRIRKSFGGSLATINTDDNANCIVFALKNGSFPSFTEIQNRAQSLSADHSIRFNGLATKLSQVLAI